MAFLVNEQTVGEAWVSYMDTVLSHGVRIPDDKEEIIESSLVVLEMEEVSEDDELVLQYGEPDIIDRYVEKMFSQEIIPEFSSTYGHRLFNYDGVDQIEWMSNRLQEKWWSKAAAISLLTPNETMPRIPCLIDLLTTVRDGRCVLTAVFRSQNVFRSYANAVGLRKIQEILAKELQKPVGKLRVVAHAPHIYASNIPRVEAILSELRT